MATIKSPATTLVILKRAKGVYQKEKPDLKSKSELRHKEIVKGLQRLREMARKKAAGPEGAKLAKPFNARKKILLKKLTEHRKKLNSTAEKNSDANKARLPAYIKVLLKITQALLVLEFATVTAEAEENINIDALEEGDPDALDRLDALSEKDVLALEQEDNAELPEGDDEDGPPKAKQDENEQADAEMEEASGKPADKPAAKPPAGDGVAVLKRFLAVTSTYQTAIASPGPHVAVLQTQYQKARGLIDAKDFAAAGKAIDGLEALLAKVKPSANNGPGNAQVGWKSARVEATQKLRQLEAMVAKTKHPLAGETVALIEVIVKRLAVDPDSKSAAAELVAYVTSDPDVAGLEEAIVESQSYGVRSRLLEALKALESELPG